MTDERMRELFGEMRDEPVPADSLARVRMKVSERTSRRRGWGPMTWLAVAAAVVLIGIVVSPRGGTPPPARTAARQTPPPAPKAEPLAEIPAPKPRIVPARLTRPPAPKPVPQEVNVRIETADPDVVIMLVGAGS